MKLKYLAAAVAIASASVGANAATFSLDLSGGTVGFGNTPIAGAFSDTFNFSLGASVLSSSINSSIVGGKDVDFSSITLFGPSASSYSFTKLLSDPLPETWYLDNQTLAAGDYSLTLVGTNTTARASYGGNISVVPAVPEPATYALLLSGLGVVGFAAMRRRKTESQPRMDGAFA